MPKLLNQLNHEEVKLNSELQFRNQKKREAKSRRNRSSSNFAEVAKFRSTMKLPYPCHCSPFLLLLNFVPLLISSYFVPVIVNRFCSFW